MGEFVAGVLCVALWAAVMAVDLLTCRLPRPRV